VGSPPKISILLPCYRQERFIREAMESILMQDFPDWELVASDDGSPDGSARILEEYARRDPRIQFYRQKINLGMAENWNFCLQNARGDAVKLMGADDRLERPDCLSRQWEGLRRTGVSLVASARNILDANSRVVQTIISLPTGVFPAVEIVPPMLVHPDNLVGEPVCCLFRRTDALRGFMPDKQQSNDVEMWFHLLEKGGLAYDETPLAAWRVTPLHKSAANWPQDQGREHLELILEKARSYPVPRATKLKVLFRSEEWITKNPTHPGASIIRTLAAELKSSFPPMEIGLERVRHRLGKTLTRWLHSLRKRLPII
jgi:hypothetical protein